MSLRMPIITRNYLLHLFTHLLPPSSTGLQLRFPTLQMKEWTLVGWEGTQGHLTVTDTHVCLTPNPKCQPLPAGCLHSNEKVLR